MRRQIEADVRSRIRLFIVLYLAYPAIILTLLGIIGAGTYLYLTKDAEPDYAELPTEPVWCGSGATPVYYPPAGNGDYESAIPPGGGNRKGSGFGQTGGLPGMPDMFGSSVQIAASSATDRIRYYVFESIRAADGSPDARFRRDMMGLTPAEVAVARQRFAERSRMDGKLGFLRLGIAQLGPQAFEIAANNDLTVPFCRPNDFSTPDPTQAYVSFAVANICDTAQATRAQEWLKAVAQHEGFTAEQRAALDLQAHGYLAAGMQVCIPQFSEVAGQTPGGDFSNADDDVDMPPPPERPTPESVAARGGAPTGAGANDDQVAASYARQLLNLGDAALAEGRVNRARRWWLRAIEAGKAVGAQASITAQKRIQTHTLTCHFSEQSLAAISRDYKALSGDLIHPKVIQQALHALGHYDGPINGNYGPVTRASIRKFQREMAFDETDTLTPLQTVYVICNAAETARDASSQNALGIMYATGLGVEQNIDLALEWLRAASTRRHADATYNLSLLYGTGIVLGSYRLCDIPQSPEQADQYLREASNQGSGRAADLLQRYGSKPGAENSRARWRLIETEELAKSKTDKTGVYAKRLATVGAKCPPDREIR